MDEANIQDDKDDLDGSIEITDAEQSAETKGRSGFILKFLIVATVLTVSTLLTFYFGVVYSSKKIALEVAKTYATGTGEDLAELYAPGYIGFFEEQFSYASFVTAQQQYIDSFRAELQPDVGDIQKIDVSIESLVTASNVEDFTDNFAAFDVHGVSKYKKVGMNWKVTGSTGTREIHAEAYVFKCDEGWFLDYILFMYD